MPIKQTYSYKNTTSILYAFPDEYSLTCDEYYRLYSFFVTYSMCGTQSHKKRCFTDYGWPSNTIQKAVGVGLKRALTSVLDLVKNNANFVFTENDDLEAQFVAHDLQDNRVYDLDLERAVIAYTQGDNKYTKLFYRIRDGFAHGLFVLRYSTGRTKMIVFEDHDKYNVTARIVIKLDTLLRFVSAVDIHRII